jgi:hypothetical protein
MLMKLTTGVNFINIFTYKFFVQTSIQQLFVVTFWLWQKNCTKKHAQKTLMKLTAGDNFANFLITFYMLEFCTTFMCLQFGFCDILLKENTASHKMLAKLTKVSILPKFDDQVFVPQYYEHLFFS